MPKPSKIKVGYGLDESIQMGPVRDKEKKEKILRYIEIRYKRGRETDTGWQKSEYNRWLS